MQTNTLLRADGQRETLPTGPLSLEQMYAAIGCHTVERIELFDNRELWMDENGLAVSEPVRNVEATRLYKAAYPQDTLAFPEDWHRLRVVGNAILSENVEHQYDE